MSTLHNAQGVVELANKDHNLPDVTTQGTGMLNDLYNECHETTYDYDTIKSAVRKLRRQEEPFFVPTEPVGRLFVQCSFP